MWCDSSRTAERSTQPPKEKERPTTRHAQQLQLNTRGTPSEQATEAAHAHCSRPQTHHLSLALHCTTPHTTRPLFADNVYRVPCTMVMARAAGKLAPQHKGRRYISYATCTCTVMSLAGGCNKKTTQREEQAATRQQSRWGPPEGCHAAAHSHNAQLQDNTIPRCSGQAHKICCCRLPHPGKAGWEKIVRARVAVRPALQLVV